MSIKEKGVEFTRPNGNSFENRHKYVTHRVQSALPFRGRLNESKSMFSLQQSPKVTTGKRRRQKIIDYEYNDDAMSKAFNNTQKIEYYPARGEKVNIILEPAEMITKNKNDSIKGSRSVKGSKGLFCLHKYPIKLKPYNKHNPPMRNDQYKPKGYDQFTDRTNKSYSKGRVNCASCYNISRIYSNKLKKPKIDNDIFGRNQIFQNKGDLVQSQKLICLLKRNQSDIFLNSNDIISINKTGEKYLFIPQFKDKYPINRESRSSWTTKASNPTLINHSNLSYHILNPNIKSIFKTKGEIMAKCNNNEYLAPRRQKSVGEFSDLTHSSAKNVNKDFVEHFEKTSRCFHKVKSLCSSMIESSNHYKLYIKPPLRVPDKEIVSN